jgi:hypothetical protein
MPPVLTISVLFLLSALVSAVMVALGKCPAWVPIIFLWVVVALMVLPK